MRDAQVLMFYFLFHYKLMMFWFQGMYCTFYSDLVVTIICMLGNFPVNKYFRIAIASPLSIRSILKLSASVL